MVVIQFLIYLAFGGIFLARRMLVDYLKPKPLGYVASFLEPELISRPLERVAPLPIQDSQTARFVIP